MKGFLSVLAVFLAALYFAAIPAEGAPNCPVGGTTIVFGNGVMNDITQASASASLLETLIRLKLAKLPGIKAECLAFKLAYDPQPSDFVIANFIYQVGGVASVQAALQFAPQFSTWLHSLDVAPPWFVAALGQMILSPFVTDLAVANGHFNLYNAEIQAGNKVIVVAHSQGNFYVNEAYSALRSPGSTSFSVVGVATPSDHVPGDGHYLTLHNDVITLVPFSLPANTVNPSGPGDPCLTILNGVMCHSFTTSYLPGSVTGPAIVDYVINAIPVPLNVNKTGAGTGRVQSTPSGIDCGSICAAAFPLLTNNSLTNVTLTATASSGSKFAGWTGECSLAGTASGNTITFPILNVTTNDCTAKFDVAATVYTYTYTGKPFSSCGNAPSNPYLVPSCSQHHVTVSFTLPAPIAPNNLSCTVLLQNGVGQLLSYSITDGAQTFGLPSDSDVCVSISSGGEITAWRIWSRGNGLGYPSVDSFNWPNTNQIDDFGGLSSGQPDGSTRYFGGNSGSPGTWTLSNN